MTDVEGTAVGGDTPPAIITPPVEPEKTEPAGATQQGTEAPAEPSKVESAGAPEKYADFTMPENVEFPKDLQEKAEPFFRELNLTQEQAQKAAEFLATERAAFMKANADQYLAYENELINLSKADKEIGGDKLAESASHASQFIQKFGRGEKGAEVFKVLRETGMDNHPVIISLFAKAHKAMAEDSPSKGEPKTMTPESVASKLYPTMRQQ